MSQLAEINVQEREQRQSAYPMNLLANVFFPVGALGNTVNSNTSIFASTTHAVPSGLQIPSFEARRFETRGYRIFAAPAARPHSHGRITGPVRVVKKIVADWNLSQREVASLLAYSDLQMADDVLNGIATLREPDREDRVRLIYAIYRVLSSLFADLSNQRRWLRTPNPLLNERAPLAVMIGDRIPGMILVRDMVDRLAGR
jgi:uncharacterized protein (DUF2384 family)